MVNTMRLRYRVQANGKPILEDTNNRDTVLMIYPNYYHSFAWHWLPTSHFFLAATLRHDGHTCVLADDRFSREETLALIDDHIVQARAILISVATGSQLRNARDLAMYCRAANPRVPIIAGGPFASARPELLLSDSAFTSAICGPGEWNITTSVYWPTRVEVGVRGDIANLPDLPYDAPAFCDIRRYLNPDTMALNYTTSTGCVGHCAFCYWHESWRYSAFPPERVAADLALLRDRYGLREISFDDPTFFIHPKVTMPLIDAIAPLGLRWRANGRVDTLREFSVGQIQRAHEAGCDVIHVGMESGSDRVLQRMNKRTRGMDVLELIGIASHSGVRLRFHVMCWTPGETLADLWDTCAVLKILQASVKGFDWTINAFTPYPGCAMTADAVRDGYKEPETLDGFERLELTNFLHLPESDRELVRETSPWTEDYIVPWYDADFNAKYNTGFRRWMPRPRTIRTTGGKEEALYSV